MPALVRIDGSPPVRTPRHHQTAISDRSPKVKSHQQDSMHHHGSPIAVSPPVGSPIGGQQADTLPSAETLLQTWPERGTSITDQVKEIDDVHTKLTFYAKSRDKAVREQCWREVDEFCTNQLKRVEKN